MADLPKSGSLLPGSNRNIFQVLFYSHLLGAAPGELEHGEATCGEVDPEAMGAQTRMGRGAGRVGEMERAQGSPGEVVGQCECQFG